MTYMDQLGKLGFAGTFGASLLSSAAQADAGNERYHDHYGMMELGSWFYGPVITLLFFALLVGAVVLMVRLLGASSVGSSEKQGDRAHGILRERFAKGEITKEEFEAARNVLGGEAS